ncbi:MAG: NAD(P)H-dependent glycerol-3-phosphate dehydrogenase [Gammaproteobacteria bacterium]
MSEPILVAGAGSWGTALAIALARNDQTTFLWGRDPIHMEELIVAHKNNRYLPTADFPANLTPIANIDPYLQDTQDILIGLPCKAIRPFLEKIADLLSANDKRIVWACKGIEPETQMLVHEIVEEILGKDIPTAVLSGPSFAGEVGSNLPTAVTIASKDQKFLNDLIERFHNKSFRAYASQDLIGVEIGGAVKNVMAIAAGIADGLGFGANTRAALITRGLAEMTRLGVAMGGQPGTFMGLAGFGDLVLTCTDNQSRNRRFGLLLAEGKSVEEAVDEIGQVVEGARTANEVSELAKKYHIEMPITAQVTLLLKGGCTPRQAVETLLSREPRQES